MSSSASSAEKRALQHRMATIISNSPNPVDIFQRYTYYIYIEEMAFLPTPRSISGDDSSCACVCIGQAHKAFYGDGLRDGSRVMWFLVVFFSLALTSCSFGTVFDPLFLLSQVEILDQMTVSRICWERRCPYLYKDLFQFSSSSLSVREPSKCVYRGAGW